MSDGRTVDIALRSCRGGETPNNLDLDVAIEAFNWATIEAPGSKTAYHALRSVTLASVRELDGLRRQMAFLESLPVEAWQHFPEGRGREAQLACCRRIIAFRLYN